jgi:GDP-D-mannose dehydratase
MKKTALITGITGQDGSFEKYKKGCPANRTAEIYGFF